MSKLSNPINTNILGISAFYHDSAACLIRNGEIVAAAEEERFTRKKHEGKFPKHAILYCLRAGHIDFQELDYVGFYDKPFLKFERIMENYLAVAPLGLRSFIAAMPVWVKEKLFTREIICRQLEDYKGPLFFSEHHESHAASAFYPSPFDEAAILTIDGVGESTTSSYGIGRGADVKLVAELHYPHSLGLLYSAFTDYIGFGAHSGEFKLMGLAPYGEAQYVNLILKEIVDLKDDGSFKLNMKYFNYLHGLTMTNKAFDTLFSGPPREPESKITSREMNIAASIQIVIEKIIMRMVRHLYDQTGMENLCLAGGVALNCVANGRILREGPFKRLWIQPAAGDAGGSLGVALLIHHKILGHRRFSSEVDSMKGSLLGPVFSDEEILSYLDSVDAVYVKLSYEEVIRRTAELLAEEKVVGWFQGRMEFGPRALGCRSILGDPRSKRMQAVMNLKIKFRESFRPFAPSILREHLTEYFELDCDSPYMLLVAPISEKIRTHETQSHQRGPCEIEKLNVLRSSIPAVTHVDYSARIQTVNRRSNPMYHDLLESFFQLTGCPVVVNTSFNVRGEPIVCTPIDAYRCFMWTGMDNLILGSFLLKKTDQPPFKEDMDKTGFYSLD